MVLQHRHAHDGPCVTCASFLRRDWSATSVGPLGSQASLIFRGRPVGEGLPENRLHDVFLAFASPALARAVGPCSGAQPRKGLFIRHRLVVLLQSPSLIPSWVLECARGPSN